MWWCCALYGSAQCRSFYLCYGVWLIIFTVGRGGISEAKQIKVTRHRKKKVVGEEVGLVYHRGITLLCGNKSCN